MSAQADPRTGGRGGSWTVGPLAKSRAKAPGGTHRMTVPAEARVGLAAGGAEAYDDVSAARMRHVMSSFGTGVTVITASAGEGPAGFTCQSFTSLSLEPPLVSFNPTRISTSWPGIREAGRFCVNVLSADQEHLARIFARTAGNAAGSAAKFAGVGHHLSPLGSPRLDGALAWIECTLEAEHDGGDHTIVVARVQGMSTAEATGPLLYFRGGYGTFAHR